jgi:hemolysin activation/secretion protein
VNRLLCFVLLWALALVVTPIPAPAADPPSAPESGRLSELPVFQVHGFRLNGNRAISNAELAPVVRPYIGRPLTFEDLDEISDRITQYYIDRGYKTSGSLVPNQVIRDGIIEIRIHEARLTGVTITGNRWLREGYVRSRLRPEIERVPVDIPALQNRLKVLEQDPRIDTLDADLSPAPKLGENELTVAVNEARPYSLRFALDNEVPPSLGAFEGEVRAEHINLTGWGDTLKGHYGLSDGRDNYALSYTVPLTRWDTTIGVGIDRSEAVVVSEPFKELDLRADSDTLWASLRHPLIRDLNRELALELTFEVRHGFTSMLGEPAGLSPGVPPETGESDVAVLRFTQQWVDRRLHQVTAFRSTFSFGLHALDATIHPEEPDGEFITWLGQLQWLRRLETLDSQVIVRGDLRLADDSLLPMEKFAIGGMSTVRGYRENEMTPDNGAIASVEWRVPIVRLQIPGISRRPADGELQVCPFFDAGYGWNKSGDDPDPDFLPSMGLGLRWYPSEAVQAVVYWGWAIESINPQSEYDIQDDGVHFSVTADVF